jgi:hypothetical protein
MDSIKGPKIEDLKKLEKARDALKSTESGEYNEIIASINKKIEEINNFANRIGEISSPEVSAIKEVAVSPEEALKNEEELIKGIKEEIKNTSTEGKKELEVVKNTPTTDGAEGGEVLPEINFVIPEIKNDEDVKNLKKKMEDIINDLYKSNLEEYNKLRKEKVFAFRSSQPKDYNDVMEEIDLLKAKSIDLPGQIERCRTACNAIHKGDEFKDVEELYRKRFKGTTAFEGMINTLKNELTANFKRL